MERRRERYTYRERGERLRMEERKLEAVCRACETRFRIWESITPPPTPPGYAHTHERALLNTHTHTHRDTGRVETLLLNITAGAEANMTKKGNMQ